ncbi:MAG: NUDIX hydrolase [Roseiarcus sp.]|jgi:8-oxo-dGTP pyrophosphatase MutT (NUDIX family)
MSKPKLKPRKQVAALAVRNDAVGRVRVMLMTSRETKRLVVPKGWPMKDRADHSAAETEAKQEAGVVGRVHRKPIGSYDYWKRLADHFVFCRVKVFLLEFERQLATWKEHDQREIEWFEIEDAAELVDKPGMSAIIRELPKRLKSPS